MTGRLPLVALISGRGSNLQAIIDAAAAGLDVEIRAAISNQPDATGLDRARTAGIPALCVDHREFGGRADFDRALAACIDRFEPRLVVLAGFMRILGPWFVDRYLGRLVNIHPSLLPKFPGLNTHARAIAAGESEHGATVHFVTPDLDAGPTIVQARVPVDPDDTPERLAARVLVEEHRIYPLALEWFAAGRLALVDGRAVLDGEDLGD